MRVPGCGGGGPACYVPGPRTCSLIPPENPSKSSEYQDISKVWLITAIKAQPRDCLTAQKPWLPGALQPCVCACDEASTDLRCRVERKGRKQKQTDIILKHSIKTCYRRKYTRCYQKLFLLSGKCWMLFTFFLLIVCIFWGGERN